jgi:putative RecB family exonuclease
MPVSRALQEFKSELHISHSQIFTYLNCSLKYRFMYCEGRPPEHISVALPFGSAIHLSLERYYLSLKDKDILAPLNILEELFEDSLSYDLDDKHIPVLYKKTMPDKASALEMGKRLLKTFYESIDLTGMEIVEVELPLSATLYTEDAEATELKLIGVIDLLLMDDKGQIIAVDHKTAAKAYTQQNVDTNLQASCYCYLLAANKFVFPTADVHCRFDVLRKLKTPKLEHYDTIRTASHRKRFAKIANACLNGIENKVFIPSPSWLCGDCQYKTLCQAW